MKGLGPGAISFHTRVERRKRPQSSIGGVDKGKSPSLTRGEAHGINEILVNGRSANCLQAWILVAQPSVQARKTTKGKASAIYES